MNIHRAGCLPVMLATVLALSACSDARDDGFVTLGKAQVTPVPGEYGLVEATLPYEWKSPPPGTPASGRAIQIQFEFEPGALRDDLAVLVEGSTVVFTATLNGMPVHSTGDSRSRPIQGSSWRAAPVFRLPAMAVRDGPNRLWLYGFIPAESRWARMGALRLGPSQSIERAAFIAWLSRNGGPLLIAAVLIAVGLVSLGLWRGRRDSQLFLLLAGGSLLWGAQGLLQQWPTFVLPLPHNAVLNLSIYVWFPMLISVFFLRFADQRSRVFERAAAWFATLAAPLFYLGWWIDRFVLASILIRGAVLVFISIALVGVMRYAWRARAWTGTLLFIISCVCVGFAIRDFVVTLGSQGWGSVILTPYSGVALVLFAGWMLLERYHRAYADYESLARDLEQRVALANVELHRRLDQVEAAHRAAEQANVSKSRFFAAASHDLRQPLHSLGLFATALRERVADGEARDLALRIGDSIEALDRLFDELLDLSRLDAGTVEVRRRAVALQPLFDRLDVEFHDEAARKGLRLRLVPSALVVDTDPMLLGRILANLVANAVRYTNVGGVLVGARRRGSAVLVEVWDTGIGIAANQKALVFDEFYQVGNPARDRRKGMGLGLAIVRRLSTLLGHSLHLDSVPGRGTHFRLELPLASRPAESAPARLELDTRVFNGRRILLVDDEPDICEATVRLLQPWGLEVRTAASRQAALALVDSGFKPDLVLADLRLDDGHDGVNVVEQLRAQLGSQLPALLLSGDTGARELVRVKQSGLLLLTKPVAPAKLRSALHALLSSASQASAQL